MARPKQSKTDMTEMSYAVPNKGKENKHYRASKPSSVLATGLDDGSGEDEEVGDEAPLQRSVNMKARPTSAFHKDGTGAALAHKSKKPAVNLANHSDVDEEIAKLRSYIKQLEASLESKDAAFEELRTLRYTAAEETLEALRTSADKRLEGSRRIVAKHAEELRQLRQDKEDLQQQLAATAAVAGVGHKRPRMSVGTSADVLGKLEEAQAEGDELREKLEKTAQTATEQRERRKTVERENARLRVEMQQLEAKLEDAERTVRCELASDMAKQEEEAARLRQENEALHKNWATETEYSKQLNAQLKSSKGQLATTTMGTSTSRLTAPTTGNLPSVQMVELQDLRAQVQLLGDLTGLVVTRTGEERDGRVFDCLMTDLGDGGLALPFKLQTHEDESCSYWPFLDAERDRATLRRLAKPFRNYLRYEARQRGPFFLALFRALNPVGKGE